MKLKVVAMVLAVTLAVNPAKADSDDALWAIGGFILGSIASDNRHHRNEDNRPVERAELPPPRKQPRIVPIYSTICEYRDQYDYWGRPMSPTKSCRVEVTGYREVYE